MTLSRHTKSQVDQAFFQELDYKKLIKKQLKLLKNSGSTLTLRKLSQVLEIQYTYLSRVLNSDSQHLSEDQLFVVAQSLKLAPQEIEYLLTLRSLAVANSPQRRKYLSDKVATMQKEKRLNVDIEDSRDGFLNREMQFLLDPLCNLVFVALGSPHLRKNMVAVCQALGISTNRYREILKVLALGEYIELTDSGEVKRVLKGKLHWGRNHPLMRAHQNFAKVALQSRLQDPIEENKLSFLATFTSDPDGYDMIQDEFQNFIKKVEKICSRSESPAYHRNLFQLSFDLIKWI